MLCTLVGFTNNGRLHSDLCHYSRIQFYVITIGYKRDVLIEIRLLSSRQICISGHFTRFYLQLLNTQP